MSRQPGRNGSVPKKAAYVATVYAHLAAFHLPFMEDLQKAGYEVHAYACPDHRRQEVAGSGFECRDVSFSRNPLSFGNVRAFHSMRSWLKRESYEIVHVHTPNASVITRLAALAAGQRNVFYTAHGFHFYKGAPFLNWLLYYPLERLAARFTDVLITINGEDCRRASRFGVRGRVALVPGVGVEAEAYQTAEDGRVKRLKAELGITGSPLIVLCMAELNRNKNQEQLLRAVHDLTSCGIPVICLLAGTGNMEQHYKRLARELNIGHAVRFLGHRSDGPLLMAAADAVALVSKREGLPKVLLEALSAGKPVVATDIRGCRDLVADRDNGFLIPVGNIPATANALCELYLHKELRSQMGARSREKSGQYRLNTVRALLRDLYDSQLGRESGNSALISFGHSSGREKV
ncbi:glycosyltransferase family 4 protein [Paenibacillus caui]|uniref:glycosyltransferase family 4 protein n=1 Tax=Paenibacillus caui TaxID=2873927 RepID=UPI001CA813CE|nr:glycosyltransferase family 4 protein [Paenibacillus caui]